MFKVEGDFDKFHPSLISKTVTEIVGILVRSTSTYSTTLLLSSVFLLSPEFVRPKAALAETLQLKKRKS